MKANMVSVSRGGGELSQTRYVIILSVSYMWIGHHGFVLYIYIYE